MLDPNTPVLVGVGLIQQREAQVAQAREPLALMIDAARAAGKDCGVADLLQRVEQISVPVGRWRYNNPGKLIAAAIRAPDAKSIIALPGVSQQTLLSDACGAIQQGDLSCALVIGGEAGNRIREAKKAGVKLVDTPSEDAADVVMKPHDEMLPDYEQRTGLGEMPVGYYAIVDSAWRNARGRSVDAHRDQIASCYSRFSEIAQSNPHAWNRTRYSAEVIRDPSSRNPMLAFPYTVLHNSQWNVDQASALLLCSVSMAQQLGIERRQWIFPQAFSEANHMVNITARGALDRCVGAELAGRAVLQAAACEVRELDFLELYSCFPVAVEAYAYELQVPSAMAFSFTGAMPFAGGPFNNFVLHAVAQLAQRLRQKPRSRGMVTTVSGILTKQGFGVWGSDPNPQGYQFVDVTTEVANATDEREVVPEYCGHGSIAGYTVVHGRDGPHHGVVVVDTPDGRRTIANTDDSLVMDNMASEDFCGRQIAVKDGHFSIRT